MIIIFPFCFGFSLYFFPSSTKRKKYTTTIIMRESAEEKERNLWGLLKREGLFRFVRWAGSLELGCLWPYSLSHWRGPLARLTHKYKYGYSRWPFGSQVSSRRVVFDFHSRLASNNSSLNPQPTDWTPQCSCRACASIYSISSLCERVLHCIALIIETGEQSEFIEGILCAPWRIEVRQLWDPLGESLRIFEVRKWKLWSVAFPFDVHFGIDFVFLFFFLVHFYTYESETLPRFPTAFWDAAFVMHFNLFLVLKCLFWCNAALLAAIELG